MKDLKGKKLLIIGGAFQHCKLVEAARELGVVTYVTDYLPIEKAPAKQIADKYFMHNISDIDDIVDMCKKEHIDGVISTSLDACQKPYQKICEKLSLPCFGTKEQFDILTDKMLFKEHCRKFGVDIIPEYSVSDFENEETAEKVIFPILVKPCESRGSRGQTICYSYGDVADAISLAESESVGGRVVIEKYMGQANDFSMTVLMINGRAMVYRTVDRYLGAYEDGLDKLAMGSVSPSKFTNLYLDNIHNKVENFYRSIGIVTAPLFMQGFVDGEVIRFYDPGLRLPGGEYERMFKAVTGKDVFYPLIEFALTGQTSVSEDYITNSDVHLCGGAVGQVLPAIKAGRISRVCGMEEIKRHPCVVSAFERYTIGDVIAETHNVNQRYCEIDLVCGSVDELRGVVDYIYETLHVYDDDGKDMIVSRIDTNTFCGY